MTLLHIVPSLLFVLLVPLQFVRSLRVRHSRFHRWTGRLVIGLGIVIGTSALLLSASPVGGIVEATATVLFGCLFLFSLGNAWWHIRNRPVELHREWVTRMVAIALGVATARPIMAVFFATSRLTGLTPEQFFGPAMWLGFVLTCLAGEAWIRYARSGTAHTRSEPISYYGDTTESTLGSTDRARFYGVQMTKGRWVMNKLIPLSLAGKLTVASLVVAAGGVVIQIVSGADYPPIPPVFFILLIPAGLIAFGRWRWTPAVAVLAGLFLTFGLFASGESPRLFNWSRLGDSVGLWVQMVAVLVAAVAGIMAMVHNYQTRTSVEKRFAEVNH